MTFKRNLLAKLPVLGMLALAAACGGGDKAGDDTAAPAGDQSATTTPAPAAPAAPAATPAAPVGDVVQVQAITTQNGASGEFQPANVTVKRGQTIRWTADGGAPHNVSFTGAENAGKSNLPQDSPYLTAAGQTFELVADLEPGTYNYVCVPHQAMGMKGSITVQ
jgi:plastocyanin